MAMKKMPTERQRLELAPVAPTLVLPPPSGPAKIQRRVLMVPDKQTAVTEAPLAPCLGVGEPRLALGDDEDQSLHRLLSPERLQL